MFSITFDTYFFFFIIINLSELAALDRKIQLELAPPTPEVGQVDNDEKEKISVKSDREHLSKDFIRNHIHIVKPEIQNESKTQSKGIKI